MPFDTGLIHTSVRGVPTLLFFFFFFTRFYAHLSAECNMELLWCSGQDQSVGLSSGAEMEITDSLQAGTALRTTTTTTKELCPTPA